MPTFHSQPETAQDQWVIEKLGITPGFFVDIGAYDGVYHSNTLTLEQAGWSGLLIEADKMMASEATINRQMPVMPIAISNGHGSEDFYTAQTWSGLKRFARPNVMAGHKKLNNPTRQIAVMPLADALNDRCIPPIIDYLSIDIEGAEYAVLQHYFTGLPKQFRCMTIEVGSGQEDLGNLINLLNPLGYRLDKIQAWDAFFINSKLL